MHISFALSEDDNVRATVIDENGDEVRTIADDLKCRRWIQTRVSWDGLTEEGERAPDGLYRVRLTLERQGPRTTLRRSVRLDTNPPDPRVMSIGPEQERTGPELLPRRDGQPAKIRFKAPGRRVEIEVWRTDRGPRLMTKLDPGEVVDGIGETEWDGTVEGRRVAPGTFAVLVRSRDKAGNIGSNAPQPFSLKRGATIPGAAGSPSGTSPSSPRSCPSPPGARWRSGWTRAASRGTGPCGASAARSPRAGAATAAAARSASARPRGSPASSSTRSNAAAPLGVPIAVDDRKDNRVLVVLPATTWQGRNPVDDDGDGLPNTLELGARVKLDRVFAHDGLPQGFTRNEAPLLAHLDRNGLSYDLTTDVALAVGRGPQIEGHTGVLLAGDTVWLTGDVRRRLRAFAAAKNHTVVSLGTDSLRREVEQSRSELLRPSPPDRTDLFGARLKPISDKQVDLAILTDDPSLQLFAGGEGLFPAVEQWEGTASVGREARALSTAVDPDNEPVVVAVRYGEGLVIRPGIAGFPTRLSSDVESQELMGRMWTLLKTG